MLSDLPVLSLTDVCEGVTLDRECRHGGYQDPASCDRCRCPDGLGGMDCEEADVPHEGMYWRRCTANM